MSTASMEKEMLEIGVEITKNIERFVDDFLRWLILYGGEDSEFVKTIEGNEEEQQQFLSDLRKATSPEALRKTATERKMPRSRISPAERMFNKMLSKAWLPSSGKGVQPEGFYLHELQKELKKELKKRGKVKKT